jgi:hypothetical protein
MPKRAFTALALGTALLLGGGASGETLEMTEAPQARDAVVSRGLSMSQVESRYGEPARRIGAVGDPPISRWVYPQFVVYFEGQYVIHAVGTPPAS